MALPAVGAIFSGVARAAATGGARAAAGAAMSGVKETARGAVRGAVKSAVGGKKGIRSGVITTQKTGSTEIQSSRGGGGGGAIVPSSSSIVPTPRSESSITPVSGSTSIVDQLRSIKSTLQQILEVERQEKEKLEDTILDFVRRDEKQRREDEQAKQEQKKGKGRKKQNPMVRAAKKAVGGIFDFIMGLVGDFIKYKILDWLGDPKNRKNVQRIVEFIQGTVKFLGALWKHVIAPLGNFVFTQLFNTLKLFGAILVPIIDLFTFKWLTNPKEFIDGIVNIPKTLIGAFKDSADALLNLLTFGLFDNMGDLISSIIKNFNPFNIFGGGEDKEEKPQQVETTVPTQEKPEQEETQQAPDKEVPKLEKGGIVGKQKESAAPSVQPLSNLIEESKLSSMITEGIMPFMEMMVAPFKIIGTAIVGMILKTVSKIPFVGELIEPIIKMSASAFGVPSEVLTQLKMGTKKETDKKEEKLDEEKIAKEMLSGIQEIEKSKEDESFGSKLSAGFKSLVGGIGNIIGSVFTPPAAAATRKTPSVLPASEPNLPEYASHADAGVAGADEYYNTETKKAYKRAASGKGFEEMEGYTHGENVVGGSIVEHLHGDPNRAGYDASHGTVADAHDHFAFSTREATMAAYKALKNAGYNVTELDVKDGHAPNSYHYSGLAFDVPWGQFGSGPITSKDFAQSRKVADIVKRAVSGNPQSTNAVAKQTPKPTGQKLNQVQQESFALDQTKPQGKPKVTVFDSGTGSNSLMNETMSSPTLGLTLPGSGLWATYRTNL